MEEAMAQVRKYTGMTTDEVKDLNEALKKIDTRTSRERLNELAGDAGKLGITAKDCTLRFLSFLISLAFPTFALAIPERREADQA